MYLARQNFLDISYQHKTGLALNWRFQQFMAKKVYFHHLFVVMTNKTEEVASLLYNYYRKVKVGDLVAFLYLDDKDKCRLSSWVEKNPLDLSPIASVLKKITGGSVNACKCSQLLGLAGRLSSNTHCNILTNFIVGQISPAEIANIKQQILVRREQGGLPYICSIMGPGLESEISVNKGINILDTVDPQAMVDMYHSFINNAALKMGKVGIECVGGELSRASCHEWRAVAFNKIERHYYGPAISYNKDSLEFMVLDLSSDSHFQFVISLELILFNQQRLNCSKKVRLQFGQHNNQSKSSKVPVEHPYFSGGFELKKDPFSSHSFVKLTKIGQRGELLDKFGLMSYLIKPEDRQGQSNTNSSD